MKKSEIKFTVSLDVTTSLWPCIGMPKTVACRGDKSVKTMMLAFCLIRKDQTTMRIDLWTQEMMVEEMQQFFFEMYMSMADTYQNATNDKDQAEKMRGFARQFGKK